MSNKDWGISHDSTCQTGQAQQVTRDSSGEAATSSQESLATESEMNIVSYLSLLKNGKKLFDLNIKDSTLQTVHGIKALGLFWIVVGQSYMVTCTLPALNYTTNIQVCNSRKFNNLWDTRGCKPMTPMASSSQACS